MQNLDLNASRWASPEVRRERQNQTSTWSSRAASPDKQEHSSIYLSQPSASNPNVIPTPRPKLSSSAQRQYITRHSDLQRFRKLFRRLAWKANSLTFWSHRALTLAQEHQARLLEHQRSPYYLHQNGHHEGGHLDTPRATLGSYQMVIDPVEAERQFKIDFYEFYALLERGLVCLLGVWGIVITASAVAAPAKDQGVPNLALDGNHKSIIGDSFSFHGSTHRFHANVISALEHPSNPLHSVLGMGTVRQYLAIAKEFRNKWKDVESRPEESFRGQERAEEEWDPKKTKRYEEVLRDLKLEELLGSVLSGLEEAGRRAEAEIERLKGLLGEQGKRDVADMDFDMEDAPFEAMAEQGLLGSEMEF